VCVCSVRGVWAGACGPKESGVCVCVCKGVCVCVCVWARERAQVACPKARPVCRSVSQWGGCVCVVGRWGEGCVVCVCVVWCGVRWWGVVCVCVCVWCGVCVW